MQRKRLHVLLIVAISLLTGYYVGVNKITADWKNYKPQIKIISKEPSAKLKIIDFSPFWTVLDKVEENYYDKKAIDPQKFVTGAINGMLFTLGDPYTVYLPPVQNTEFKQGLSGQFEGIGAQLGVKGEQIVVIAPLDGSPAQKAGVKAGDVIVKVNSESTKGWNISQAVEKIRGPKRTEVVLTVTHKNEPSPVEIKIIRDTIQVKSVEGKIEKWRLKNDYFQMEEKACEKCPSILYVRLSQFGDNTNKEWLSTVNKLALEIPKDNTFKGIVLDLRNNPGGYLQDATFIASEFISGGTVVIQEKGNGEKIPHTVSRKGLFLSYPIVVLINKGSASASEIVAGALRDHKRAKLVGETSFGKGTIQQAEDLGSGSGIHITVAKWLTPNEIWVNGKGLEPDIKVEPDKNDVSKDVQLEKAVEELVK
ncbi:MAG: hypothetical protein A3F31_03230 [Candidatus Levybacteria bacterium RIFCSPHIGHO2_12_FULL_38_12]|nr:MAG: hypothetical protein A2770_03655 [Candidatus Levybacteria bacterium RIFCSPHIGHO2_01_FULL_38_12]OGH22113.1 MAG: hypothetical protein A3D75_02600 [Candidatus Levybacteria bacterium RIFCSPHIGHO2_02_FULL_37_18]OGH22961.1 MAG: hypothetical protein A3F31_03230 [Candidatus Levybacteria bacterium RIFCSPHIGHO2_12_FULL_38_12]OGH34131.1 MAG: hypothetical protein A3A47_03360 [Candidatus Levybacteria bacterium RIFCSPLOWO2_01_FULL_37_20]OGH44924.1 MAG: hypothetical protein A3J14_01025 [Candidatus Lev